MDITPQTDQMIKESPAEPVSFITPVGVTKMPEPMMVPMIIPTPLRRVMLRLSSIFSPLPVGLSAGLLSVGVGTREVDGQAAYSTTTPSWSGSASAGGKEGTAQQVV